MATSRGAHGPHRCLQVALRLRPLGHLLPLPTPPALSRCGGLPIIATRPGFFNVSSASQPSSSRPSSRRGRGGLAPVAAALVAAGVAAGTSRDTYSCEERPTSKQTSASADDVTFEGEHDSHASQRAELRLAIRNNDVARSMSLIKQVLPSIDSPLTSDGQTPLILACRAGSTSLARALLASGADATITDAHGETCVAAAAAEGHMPIVQGLTQTRCVSLKKPDAEGYGPIHKALYYKHWNVVSFLLCRGVSANQGGGDAGDVAVGPALETPLHVVVRTMSYRLKSILKLPRYEAMDLLLNHGADPTRTDGLGDSTLHHCARQGDIVGLWFCLLFVPDVAKATSIQNAAGSTVIQEADAWGIDGSLVVRLSAWLPVAVRRQVAALIFSENLAILLA
eukprot:TRINITY_DN68936_c0_g1_i1.p1 TRINITY_DN68936_c0_g1~~TRINITY_DN68936_c0_g1_i1.p1  ORF type:complete len:396 (-),score=55.16 TRINITY_DN68936_c0_g1_i1:100-1287(-)